MLGFKNETAQLIDDDLARALNGRVSYPEAAVYYLVWVDQVTALGVVGDGAMGLYEHFVFSGDVLQVSDKSYGNPVGALRDVLNQEWPA